MPQNKYFIQSVCHLQHFSQNVATVLKKKETYTHEIANESQPFSIVELRCFLRFV